MKTPRTLLLVALAASGWACSGSSDLPTAPSATPTPTPLPAAVARYRVTFEAVWTAQTHPTDAPPGPHFSGLIGGTHRDPQRFWSAGAMASEGIRLMAEEGRKSPLDQEVQAAINSGAAQYLLSGGAIASSPGRVELEFDISRDHPLVTLVSMIAPSPDWFVGVSAMSLLEGDWVAERVVPLFPYDAGTDSGVTFLSANRATAPREPIARLQGTPFLVGGSVPALGTFTFRRLS
jgi:hypothetical protein